MPSRRGAHGTVTAVFWKHAVLSEPGEVNRERMKNFLTFDIEEAFHSSNFLETIPPDRWESLGGRVIHNTERILERLAEVGLRATFFIVGWVAEHYPEVVRLIDGAGHETAAHTFAHRLIYEMTKAEFRSDIRRNVEAICSITGKPVLGFRAPSYTITPRTLWSLDILLEEGFRYDSSVYPIRYHSRYGFPGAPRLPYRHPNGLLEFPLPAADILGQRLPVATGVYFRVMPYALTRRLIRRINATGIPVAVNLHPWELDPDQPPLPIKPSLKWRHYYGLARTEGKLRRLLADFEFETLGEAADAMLRTTR